MLTTGRNYLQEVNERLSRLAKELHDEAIMISDERGQVLFETAAEALDQLKVAFAAYEIKDDELWM